MEKVDAVIIGAGVVGLAIGARLSPRLSNIIIIDQNERFGEEISSRNSEVIHGGLYYPQPSLKAKLCVEGKAELYQYCLKRNIPFRRLGKLILAQNSTQEAYLERLLVKAKINGVDDLIWQSSRDLHHFSTELKASSALLSPSTGIIDSHRYMQSLLADSEQNGATFVARTRFIGAETTAKGFIIRLDIGGEQMTLRSRLLINSAGLYATDVAHKIDGLGKGSIPELHWCKGHYFSYGGKNPFSKLVYPVPETNITGLGIHATLDMGGQLKFGPDTQYISRSAIPDYSLDSSLKPKFLEAIRRYFPGIEGDKLQPSYSGIRPKLQGPDKRFADFRIDGCAAHGVKGLVNLFGIESPGLTASLAIAKHLAVGLEIES
ncbi:NAD(P)/FAD-dependent oxidoreductase [Shewanella violacea]|uniref:FAD dependent oxidoreductase family n=1 Tax=Shewanella violacea (strain JCM 10179 / CIP 106290 / LMG 19151 / DSS12) TaxID=637905 RepID=D4ZCF8_SHEVD|nr:NAD(P)/FAD-dependent oxidoreductase [Shewanella violacea]BAJ03703.1 FAD dependent oxidoreductase family [Shewanella violacea DSS12]